MSVKERIIEFIKYKKISQSAFEKQCGLSNGYINNIRRSISDTVLQKISLNFPELNPIWLMMGKESMLNANTEETLKYKNAKQINTSDMNWIQIPFIPVHARATFAETFETEIHELSTLTIPRLPGINYENGKVFEVDGDSMDPTLITGEQVFCEYVDPADWKYITGPVVIAFGNNLIVVKRIKENNLANGELTLWSDNEMGGKLTLHTEQDQIRRMYKVRYTVYKPIR